MPALAEPLDLREGQPARHLPQRPAPDSDVGAHFAQYVRDLLPKLLGQKEVNTQLRVTTTLDYELQVPRPKTSSRPTWTSSRASNGATNGALVSIDPRPARSWPW